MSGWKPVNTRLKTKVWLPEINRNKGGGIFYAIRIQQEKFTLLYTDRLKKKEWIYSLSVYAHCCYWRLSQP